VCFFFFLIQKTNQEDLKLVLGGNLIEARQVSC